MIPYLDCHATRARLDAFVDGELEMGEQVAVESHLRWCRACAEHVDAARAIGDSLRATAGAVRSANGIGRQMWALRSTVVTRLRAEHDQSLASTLRGLCADMRFFWPAVGASTALLVCVAVALTMYSATSSETPDSLAGVIDMLANPGSDRNPMRLDGGMTAPPRALNEAALDSVLGDEAMFALSAVVTREGRVATYEVLSSERASVRRHEAAVGDDDMSSVVNAVNQSRFSPAQGVDGEPVAVSMVWVLARTTVKASARAWVAPTVPRVRPVPETPPGAADVSKPDAPATSAAPAPASSTA